MNTAR
jgi:hypothetical protein